MPFFQRPPLPPTGIRDRIAVSWTTSMDDLALRRARGSQHWEADFGFLVAANVFYFTVLAGLHVFMKSRPAANPARLMQVYNVSCVVLAGISGVAIATHKWQQPGAAFVCNPRGQQPGQQLGDVADGLLTWGIFVYYYQKYWEFLDTFFFMLRKSYRQVSFLHVYHHSSITVVTCLAAQFDTAGDVYLAALLNSWIHVFMYSHYWLTSIGVKNAPWRPYLTSMQLAQFLVILVQNVVAWFAGHDCGMPDWYKAVLVAYMASMLVLFGHFFVSSYTAAPKPKRA